MAPLNPDAHRRGHRHRINSGSDTFGNITRGRRVELRLTVEEKAAIDAAAAKASLDVASWVRQQVFKALTTDDLNAGRQTVHQPREKP